MQSNLNSSILVLNGGSSSGKSSITRVLQETLPGIWLTFGVDTFIEALPARGNSPKAGVAYQPDGTITFSAAHRTLEHIWYDGLANMAGAGAHLILDEVLLSGGARQQHLTSVFGDVSMVWVGVRCDAYVAAAREGARGDRVEGMARQQALSVHLDMKYDFEVDTTHYPPEKCAQDISDWLLSFQ